MRVSKGGDTLSPPFLWHGQVRESTVMPSNHCHVDDSSVAFESRQVRVPTRRRPRSGGDSGVVLKQEQIMGTAFRRILAGCALAVLCNSAVASEPIPIDELARQPALQSLT